MPYNRMCTLGEVEDILRQSEIRKRPYSNNPLNRGHAVSLHSSERTKHIFSRQNPRDSMFLGSFKDYNAAIHEVLNSKPGQVELKKLNAWECQKVTLRGVILRQRGEIDLLTKFFPKEQGAQGYFEWLSTLKGEGYIVQILVVIWKLDPPTANCDIHIHTAYPEQYARIENGNIMEII